MRRTTIAALAAAALLTLTACGGDSGSKAEPQTSKSTAYKLRPEDQWVQSINSAGITSWADKSPSREELTAMPEGWCAALKAGHSVEWLLGEGDLYPIGEDWGTEKGEAQELVVLGSAAYCPKFEKRVKAELRESGAY
ncbi:hypothetical protein GCM10010277_68370 [Streptomyces longisporoflavus]|uniref:hypothetical protein n=1 Tax=Streptomyces longisporoflavus TaxID=28044 RepID=UPI00167DDB4E|nr:hypothetical protein [Streptomyces longisporoflavus]GGV62805.1 hypothetical protein GCM10010277_68370 [Streptomyces longisporoflavus]